MILRRNNPKRITARAVIIRGGELLVFKRRKLDLTSGSIMEYYSIPGGGVEKGESLEQAAARELYEEMSVRIEIIRKVAVLGTKNNREHHVYWATIAEGKPMLNVSSEEYRLQSRFNSYEVQWINIDSLDAAMFRWGFERIIPLVKNISLGQNISETRFFDSE